jgi:predicted transposase YdaD
MDDEDVSQALQQDFLEVIRSKLSLQFEADEMETSQGRLWYLYTCSAEVKGDKVMPLHVSKERLMKVPPIRPSTPQPYHIAMQGKYLFIF